MRLTLPPSDNGIAKTIEASKRQVTIIGANGAGKSLFTEAMIDLARPGAYPISALHALYGMNRAEGTAIADEVLEVALGRRDISRRTEAVREIWQEVFPGNRILDYAAIHNLNTADLHLSDGERALLYYIGAAVRAPRKSIVFVDNPSMFMHPSVTQTLWNRMESLRKDCTFIYTTHDVDFAGSRTEGAIVWVRSYNPEESNWTYEIIDPHTGLPEAVYLALLGGRKPVLFIEGDDVHSIDAKLYPLVFPDFTVKALGSCNKVIESVRTFNDLQSFHHLKSRGIVDRDRRDEYEVNYLRRKNIMVPDAAEIENILMIEPVVRAMARELRRNESTVFNHVRKEVVRTFETELKTQALEHTRHRIKRLVEYRIDRNLTSINLIEDHLRNLNGEIRPRELYEGFCREFHRIADEADYSSILKVFNHKTLIQKSKLPNLLGLRNASDYIDRVMATLRRHSREADSIRSAIAAILHAGSLSDE